MKQSICLIYLPCILHCAPLYINIYRYILLSLSTTFLMCCRQCFLFTHLSSWNSLKLLWWLESFWDLDNQKSTFEWQKSPASWQLYYRITRKKKMGLDLIHSLWNKFFFNLSGKKRREKNGHILAYMILRSSFLNNKTSHFKLPRKNSYTFRCRQK